MYALRPYQQEAIACVAAEYTRGCCAQVIVMPTGTGKTAVAANIPDALGAHGRVLFLVHRDELALQAAETFQRWTKRSVGIEKAEMRAGDAEVVVGSVQTLRNHRLEQFNPEQFDVIITDECHHATADSYRRIYEHFRVAKWQPQRRNRNRLLLGITATPFRSDNVSLTDIFDRVTYPPDERTILWYMEHGWLVDVVGVSIETHIDLDAVRKRMGDFVVGELASRVDTPTRNRIAVDAYRQYGENLPAIVFCVNKKHVEHMEQAFRQAGYRVASVVDSTPTKLRRQIIDAYRAGKIQVLINCSVVTEGVDLPNACVAVMARPTQSLLLYQQCVGRVLRPYPSPEELQKMREQGVEPPWIKTKAIVIDLVDLTHKHHLATLPRLAGLPSQLKFKNESLRQAGSIVRRIEQQFNIEFDELDSLDNIEVKARFQSLFAPPAEIGSMVWSKTRHGYQLVEPDGRTIWRLHEDTIGRWHILKVINGISTEETSVDSLQEAVSLVESLVPAEGSILMKRQARWRRQPPTPKQIEAIWKMSSTVRELHHSYEQWEEYALTKLTRGTLSDVLSRLISRKALHRVN